MVEPAAVPRALRLGGLVVAVEALLALAAALTLGVLTVLETPLSYGLAVAGVALGLAAAVGLARVARGLDRAEAWSRAPATVTQLLLLPVGWTLASTNDRPLFGVPLLVLAVLGLGLLFTPSARRGLEEV